MVAAEGLWNPAFRLRLASKSSSRRELLRSAGVPFDVDGADIDERAVEREFFARGGFPDELPVVLARAKALEVSRRNPRAFCLGADQVLHFQGEILHKAETMREAERHLSRLSGKTHRLVSAFAIAADGEILHEDRDSAGMTMRSLDPRQIALYLAWAGPTVLSSVGVYQLEALGVHLFERIEGNHSTILGLPLLKLLAWLRRAGALLI
jgi:septum formation protein